MKMLLLSISLVFLSACASSPTSPVVGPTESVVNDSTPRATETLYNCTYKYDSKYNIAFLGSNRVEFHPPSMPSLLVYHIVDIKGVNWAVNEYDWENYTCIPTITKG